MAILSLSAPAHRVCRIFTGRVAALLVFVVCVFVGPATTKAAAPSEAYQLKAVFLYNFAQFVDWPETAFASPTAPLVIGILGDDPFGQYLDDLVKGEKVGARPLAVRRLAKLEDVRGCQILFVCSSETRSVRRILARCGGQSVLTVSDIGDFARRGGMVGFTNEAGKIRLRINLDAAKAAGLTISSKILRPEMIVTTDME